MADHTDQITLSGLRVHGYHGVYDRERADGQEFIIDVTLDLDTRKAALSDNIQDTVHYGNLADALVTEVAGAPVRLLETLADRLAGVCLADPRVISCVVTVHKPFAPIPHNFTDVSVTIERSRE
ncbi:dihydroneopterin aldolase [Stackebrandtia nassauensis]|uniref:7,8-dihydroneopterin aldolase n=1 Tax=Stackebrandtia nassauensis (strain DSM 44728 / CIP 108903 / NRRL B-16338 / NBRC 102104 / LLR-40K-21) TaxID=446470 RepID=D3Q2T7_STANL|nr:dihydroneopterin aldolase [Stackebrandtia nassauensis]ADD45838.1 dihydroneopterin aldolase [Stackebrandtia nassauensis DSM 44728]